MKKVLLFCLLVLFCTYGVASAQWIIEDQTYSAYGYSLGSSYILLSSPTVNASATTSGFGFSGAITKTHGEGNTPSGVYSSGFATIGTDYQNFQGIFIDGNSVAIGVYTKVGGEAFTGGIVIAPNATTGYSGGEPGDPGWYIKDKNPQSPQYGRIQYFNNGQPENSSEWSFLGSSASGDGPVNDKVFSSAVIGGSVFQANQVTEFGFSTGAFAGNMSGGSFIAANYDYAEGKHEASAGASIAGSIETGGYSLISNDPYGPEKSATAMTGNFARVNASGTPDYYSGGVFGAGGTGVYVISPDAIATGTAGFSYNGKTFGSGDAYLHSEVYDGGNWSISKSIGRVTVGAF